MKKHLLFLATLVLGLGQVYADEVTFSVGDLKASLPASNTNIAVPYAWKTSPYHVTATIEKTDGTTGTLGVSQVIPLNANYKVTVSVAGAGTLNSIKFTTNPTTRVQTQQPAPAHLPAAHGHLKVQRLPLPSPQQATSA